MSISTRALTLVALGAAALVSSACERRTEPTDLGARPAGDTPDKTGTETRPTTPTETQPVDRPMERKDPMAPVGGKTLSANDPSIRSIAMARCDREEKCANVGAGKTFATREACETKLLVDVGDELKMAECPGGIVQKELDECLAEIKSEDCKSPIDKLERLAACRSGDMCKAIN